MNPPGMLNYSRTVFNRFLEIFAKNMALLVQNLWRKKGLSGQTTKKVFFAAFLWEITKLQIETAFYSLKKGKIYRTKLLQVLVLEIKNWSQIRIM